MSARLPFSLVVSCLLLLASTSHAQTVEVVEYLFDEVTVLDEGGKAIERIARDKLPKPPVAVVSVAKQDGFGIADPTTGRILYLDRNDIKLRPEATAQQVCSMLQQGATRPPADRVQAGVMGIGPGCH